VSIFFRFFEQHGQLWLMAFTYELANPTAIRIFARCLTALLRIGDELYVEPSPGQLALRILNGGRSAHIIFTFFRPFFERLEAQGDLAALPNYKIPIRSLLNVFKAPGSIQSAALSLAPNHDRLTITLECLRGLRKVYGVTYEDFESPKAQHVPDPDNSCAFQAEPRTLALLLSNLSAKVDKATLVPEAARLHLRSHVDEELASVQLRTECAVDTRDLLGYRYATGGPAFSKTFQLKEFKALLGFCEANTLPLQMSFGRGNEPLLCETQSTDDPRSFHAALLVAAFDEMEDASTAFTAHTPEGRIGSQAPSIRSFNSPLKKGKEPRTPHSVPRSSTPEPPPQPIASAAASPSAARHVSRQPHNTVTSLLTPPVLVAAPDVHETPYQSAKRLRTGGSPLGIDHVSSSSHGSLLPALHVAPDIAAPAFEETAASRPWVDSQAAGDHADGATAYPEDADPPHRYEYCPLSWEEDPDSEDNVRQAFVEPSPSPPRM